MTVTLWIILRMFVETFKTHILCSIQFSENRAVYEKMWENVVVPDRPQNTIQYGEKICDVHVR